LSLRLAAVDLHDVVVGAVEATTTVADARGVSLELEATSTCPRLWADAARLRQGSTTSS